MTDTALIKHLMSYRNQILAGQVEALEKLNLTDPAKSSLSLAALTERAELTFNYALSYIQERDRGVIEQFLEKVRLHAARYSLDITNSRLELTDEVVKELSILAEVLQQVLSRTLGRDHRLLKKVQVRLESMILLVQFETSKPSIKS
ncbi:MAG: hypothetical protein WCS37_11470 [Chloroflexota bacterium]|nr:hypothetical protein [Chloroflexota bacterium]